MINGQRKRLLELNQGAIWPRVQHEAKVVVNHLEHGVTHQQHYIYIYIYRDIKIYSFVACPTSESGSTKTHKEENLII